MRHVFLILFALLATRLHAEPPCGPDAACEIENGSYHLRVPAGWDGVSPLPALVFFHGHNATGGMIFRAGGLKADFLDQGYLLIAPNGEPIQGRKTRRWPAHAGGARDDVAFTRAVVADAKARLPIDPARIYAAGFSAGGSMVWQLACFAAAEFSGFVSVSGALRRPNPSTNCPNAPVRFLHIHGFSDAQVPFEGRGIRDWHQGDVFDALAQARRANACRSNPDDIEVDEPFRCRSWQDSCAAGAVRLCIHDGGHGLPRGWTARARAWFEDR